MEDPRYFGLLLCCHCFSLSLGFTFGTSSIQTTERWQQAHWWVCRAAISLASWTSIFNWLRIDVLSFFKQVFLQPIPKMIKVTEWRLSIASLDFINGPFQLANLPQLMKQPLTHHALRRPIFLGTLFKMRRTRPENSCKCWHCNHQALFERSIAK